MSAGEVILFPPVLLGFLRSNSDGPLRTLCDSLGGIPKPVTKDHFLQCLELDDRWRFRLGGPVGEAFSSFMMSVAQSLQNGPFEQALACYTANKCRQDGLGATTEAALISKIVSAISLLDRDKLGSVGAGQLHRTLNGVVAQTERLERDLTTLAEMTTTKTQQLENQCLHLLSNNQKLGADNAKLEERAKSLEERANNLEGRVKSLGDSVSTLTTTADQLASTCKSLSTENERLKTRITALSQVVQKSNDELVEQRKLWEGSGKNLGTEDKKNQEKSEALAQQCASVIKTTEKLAANYTELVAENKKRLHLEFGQKSVIQQLQSRISQLEGKCASAAVANAGNEQLKAQVSRLVQREHTLSKTAEELVGRCETLSAETEKLKTAVTSSSTKQLEEKYKSIAVDNDRLKNASARMTATIEGVDTKCNRLATENEKLKNESTALAQRNDYMDRIVKGLGEECDAVAAQNEQLKTEMASLVKKEKSTQDAFNIVVEEHDKLRAETLEEKKRKDDLVTKYDNLAVDIEQMRAQAAKLGQEVALSRHDIFVLGVKNDDLTITLAEQVTKLSDKIYFLQKDLREDTSDTSEMKDDLTPD